MIDPHYPTTAELAGQRETFVLDSAEDRPYHHLAHGRAARGKAWDRGIGLERGMIADARIDVRLGLVSSGEPARLARIYVSEVPFLRTRAAGDGERWVEALRAGSVR